MDLRRPPLKQVLQVRRGAVRLLLARLHTRVGRQVGRRSSRGLAESWPTPLVSRARERAEIWPEVDPRLRGERSPSPRSRPAARGRRTTGSGRAWRAVQRRLRGGGSEKGPAAAQHRPNVGDVRALPSCLHLGCVSSASRLHLGCISGASRPMSVMTKYCCGPMYTLYPHSGSPPPYSSSPTRRPQARVTERHSSRPPCRHSRIISPAKTVWPE